MIITSSLCLNNKKIIIVYKNDDLAFTNGFITHDRHGRYQKILHALKNVTVTRRHQSNTYLE